ncbi:Alpha/beta hydrolase fold-1 [Podospora appendiculata]|uniref:Alpha/beta hydrolase fold-1 n=1 Tax=Podospora appendiculata TaxID=314037 RepID=A0AAE1C9G7_9PEZI|nr:Alpha/beta hydrolase fold-1 [Podospora appendiculata]
MPPKPTLIFVPGAWYPVDTWDKVTAFLEAKDYKCVRVALPSSTTSDPSTSFLDDVTAVRTAILAETTQGTDVVVVVHSYGGLPGHSASKGLTQSKTPPPAADKSGHVLGFAMLASGFTMTGMSFLGGFGGKPPPSWEADTESGFAVIVAEPRDMFFHDLPEAEGAYWVERLGRQSLKALAEGGEHAYAGWMDAPVWYLQTAEDRALPLQAQRMFVQMARNAGGDVTVREVESGHSPMLSRAGETAEFVEEAVVDFLGR